MWIKRNILFSLLCWKLENILYLGQKAGVESSSTTSPEVNSGITNGEPGVTESKFYRNMYSRVI